MKTTKNIMSSINPTTLSGIVKELGISYPSGFPDIQVSDVEFTNESIDKEKISATISLEDLINASSAFQLLKRILPDQYSAKVEVEAGLSSGFGLKITFDDFRIPLPENNGYFPVKQPLLAMDFNPSSGSWDVQLMGSTALNILGKNIEATLDGIINETEANLGLDVIDKESFLFTPPALKGVHIKEIGGEVGMFFEPPGLDLGFTGQCYIGHQGKIPLDDDRFALVMDIQEESAEVKYLSFYVPRMDVNQMLEIFTDQNERIETKLSLSELEFFYAPSGVLLPNGDTSPDGISGRCAIDIVNFGFYGFFKKGSGKDISMDFECDPIHIKRNGHNLLKVTGNGKGIKQKVDKNGNPIKYNKIKNDEDPNQPLQSLIDTAAEHTLVKAGGPKLQLQTKSSPYLNASVHVQLLDIISEDLDAHIGNDGFQFIFNSRAFKTQGGANVSLLNRNEFSANFFFKFNNFIELPDILGQFKLDFSAQAFLDATYKKGKIKLTAQAFVNRTGKDISVGPFEVAANIHTISDLIAKFAKEVEKHGEEVFEDFVHDAEKWAKYAFDDVITVNKEIAKVLKDFYKKSAKDAAKIMKNAGAKIDYVAHGLKNMYKLSSTDASKAMKYAGYKANDVAKAFKKVGYSILDTAKSLHNVYGVSGDALIKSLGAAGYASHEVKDLTHKVKDFFHL